MYLWSLMCMHTYIQDINIINKVNYVHSVWKYNGCKAQPLHKQMLQNSMYYNTVFMLFI